ncbi:MAG: acyltransferase [Beijerinckiaceae bacterium]
MNPTLSRFIDATRAVAALIVMVSHTTHAAIVGSGAEIAHPAALMILDSASHQSVIVFFVLSGYLIGGRVIAFSQAGKPFLCRFLVDRTIRIYLVLVPALVLTAVLDALVFGHYAAGPVARHFERHFNTLEAFAGNLASLQNIFTPTFGSNAAMWTLGLEFWFYIVAGFLGAALTVAPLSRARRVGLMAAGLAMPLATLFTPSYFLFGAIIWAAGAFCAHLAPTRLHRPAMAAGFAIACCLAAFFDLSNHPPDSVTPVADAFTAFGFANLLLALAAIRGDAPAFLRAPPFAYLSNISFSIYATHMPIGMFLAAVFGFLPFLPLLAVLLPATLVASIAFHHATEAHTGALRAVAHRWLARVSGRSGLAGA